MVERRGQKKRLGKALILTSVFLVVEVIGGFLSNSLALLADAAHMGTDVAALILAYAAMSVAERAPSGRYTFGLHRAEVLAAFVNAQVLLVASGYILYEAVQRFRQPRVIETWTMIGVAAAGLTVNMIALRLLGGATGKSLNVQAAALELLTDTLSSISVVLAGTIIWWSGWIWVDPVVSAGIGLFIIPRTLSLLKQSGHILLEGAPADVDQALVRRQILSIPGVAQLHDLHLWTLTSGRHSASVHVRITPGSPPQDVYQAVAKVLKESAGMDHATIQVEGAAEVQCAIWDDQPEAR